MAGHGDGGGHGAAAQDLFHGQAFTKTREEITGEGVACSGGICRLDGEDGLTQSDLAVRINGSLLAEGQQNGGMGKAAAQV